MKFDDCVVIIPCHNEEISILKTIEEIRLVAPNAKIIVIDNASTDNTGKLVANAGVQVVYEPRLGKGFAIRRGFAEVMKLDCAAVFTLDGDNTYSTKEFPLAYKEIKDKKYDMVVGTRVPSKNNIDFRDKPFRIYHKTGNSLLTMSNKILFGMDIHDTLSGWRIMSKGFVSSFYGGDSGFEIESELNAHSFVLACAVGNIEIEYRGRLKGSESKLNTFKDGVKILKMQLRLFKSERPKLAYSLIATPWAIMSVVLIKNVLVNYFETRLIPNFPSLIAGVGAFQVSIFLWGTGLILDHLRLNRVQTTRMIYNNSQD